MTTLQDVATSKSCKILGEGCNEMEYEICMKECNKIERAKEKVPNFHA